MITVNQNLNYNELLELVKKVGTEGERIIIETENQGKVALINYDNLKLLEDLEDARDVELLKQAIAESKDQPSITFDELLDELGLTREDLISGEDSYRVDQGEYRILYTVDNDKIRVFKIGKRNDDEVYQNL
jgi:mRNA-degrading endonuclease RelE of RelBE toxin-antitoxin system